MTSSSHWVSFVYCNRRQNCFDTFLKRGVLGYPEPQPPPPLTLLGGFRVPTNIVASGTTFNRGRGEGVPLKGISHPFLIRTNKTCS